MIICEPECVGFAHEEVNAGIIGQLLKAGGDGDNLLVVERQHLSCIRTIWSSRAYSSQDFSSRFIKPRRKLWDFRPLKILYLRWLSGTLLKEAERRGTPLVFLSVSTELFMVLHQLSPAFENVNIIIVNHGILEQLVKEEPVGKADTNRWFGTWFFRKNRMLNNLIISPHIAQNLRDDFGDRLPSVSSIHHPSVWMDIEADRSASSPVHFATIGKMGKRKGEEELVRLFDRLKGKPLPFLITILGYLAYSTEDERITIYNRRLSREEISRESAMADYFILPFRKDSYRYMVSGVLFDAFNYGKPVIALSCSLMDYYFSAFGDIGYLCRDEEELYNTISSLSADFPVERYKTQVQIIMKARKMMDKENETVLAGLLNNSFQDEQ
ncbi:MAG: hypothetical protein JEY99_09240 [Spirochaetales bacterium]|nr:hypothetical protein [Spirochaetales bacterium]